MDCQSALLQALLPLATKPAFSFLYRATLASLPGLYRLVVAGLYCGVFLLLLYTHFGLRARDRRDQRERNQQEEMEKLKI